jgi:replicative DNA helicase
MDEQEIIEELKIFEADLRPMPYWATLAQEKIDRWATGVPEGWSTGFKTIDTYARLVNGELTVIAARPGMGKTAIAMQMVESVARQLVAAGDPGCVAVFSAEMSGWSLVIRMASALSGVNMHKMRMGKGDKSEIQKLKTAVDTLRALPIWIDDGSGPTAQQMLRQLAELNHTNPVRMMMFDFLELAGDRGDREDIRISRVVDQLHGIAKTLQIPVLALSQLNREVESRADKMPMLSDLRYSGMIEQAGDVIMFVMRPEYYVERSMSVDVPETDKRGVAYVQVAKNKNGPVGLAKLAFVKDRAMFSDLAKETA